MAPTMTPSTPAKRVSSPTRIALRAMSAKPTARASWPTCANSPPMTTPELFSASAAAEFERSAAWPKSAAPRVAPILVNASPTP